MFLEWKNTASKQQIVNWTYNVEQANKPLKRKWEKSNNKYGVKIEHGTF